MAETYCDVSLGEYDGDEATFYHEREVNGRKAHRCYECRETIEQGTRHQVVSGKWDGEVSTYRFCAPCWEVMGEFSDGARAFGATWDTFQSEWASGATLQGCLNRLTSVEAKQHMTRRWQEWKGLA